MEDESFPVRSYRLCFAAERRIHQVDRWRIPVPYGIPLRGIAYAAGALLTVLVLSRLPVIGDLLVLLHPALRLMVLPVGAAYLLTNLRMDGRPAHAAALSWLAWQLAPKPLSAFAAADPAEQRLEDLALCPDERGAHYRPAVVSGPAEVLLRYPAAATQRGSTLELRQIPGRPMWSGRRISLAEGQRLRLR